MAIEHVGRVYGGVLYDEDNYLYFRTDDGDVYALGQGAVAVAVARIILYHPGSNLQFFDVDSAGLTAAFAAAVSGDHVDLPGACVISGAHTVPGGVTLGARGGKARLTGPVTLGAGSGLRDLAVEITGSGTQAAVVGPDSGEAFVRGCYINVVSSDDEAVGVRVGAGDVVIWDCHIITDGDTSSHCVRLTAGGDAYLHYTRFTHPAAGTSFVEPSPGAEYYSDQGWTIVQPGSSVVALDGHDDVDRGTFSTLQLDTGYVLPGSDTITWRVGSNGIAYIYTQWSDNGTDWNTDWIGSYAINSGGAFISITRPNYGRYMRMVRYDGNTNPFFAWASVNNYVYNEVTGYVYTQACTGDTTGTIPLAGDRAAYDASGYPTLHTNDTDDAAASLHHSIGSGQYQAAAGNHDHGTRTENVLVAQGATAPALKDSHLKDGITGAYLAELIAALTDDRAYTLQDADMTLAALNLAQTWTALQSFLLGESPATSVGFHVMNTGGVELITDAANRDFSSGNAWSGSNWSTASGALVHTPTSSVVATLANANLTAGSILSGRYYVVTFTCTVTAGTFAVRLGTASSGTIAASGTYTVAILATADDADFNILPLSTFNGSIDDISLKRLAAEFVIRNDGHIGVGTDTPDTDSWYHVVTYDPGTAKFKVENKAQGSAAAAAIEVKMGASGQRVLLIQGGPEINSTTFEAFAQRGALMTDPTLGLGLSLVARQSAGDIRFYIGGVASSNRVMTLYSTHLDHAHCYGSMYQDDTGTTITVSATNTDYIVTGMSSGAVNQFTFQNNQELKCLIPGKYKVTWSVSFVCGSANQEVEGAVGVNGTRVASTSAHAKVTTASADQCMSGTGILTLAVNDLVQIVVRNETSAANIIVDHANLTLDWVGA